MTEALTYKMEGLRMCWTRNHNESVSLGCIECPRDDSASVISCDPLVGHPNPVECRQGIGV